MGFWGDAYDDTIGKILPKKPDDVTKSPAYGAENSFASGLGTQRSNFTGQQTPTITEGTAPSQTPSGPSVSDVSGKFGPGGKAAAAYAAQHGGALPPGVQVNGSSSLSTGPSNTQYADPTGMNAQKDALGLDKTAAEGNAPSAAEQLYRKGTDEGMAAQLGLAATTQGSNPGMSQRAGLAGAAGVSNANAAGAGALRASEMANARDQYGNEANATRGQTLDEAKANQTANIQQQLANNQFYLGLTDEQQKALVAMLGGAQANATNQQAYNASNQEFFGNLISQSGKGAAGAPAH